MDKAVLGRALVWVKGLIALALFAAVIVETFVVDADDDPSDVRLRTLAFLLGAFLAWNLWAPTRPSYTIVLWAIIVVLVLVSAFL